MRQRAETVRGPYWQTMWAQEDVCGLFANTVGPSAENVGPRRYVFADNVDSIVACLRARGITFVGRYTYPRIQPVEGRVICEDLHAIDREDDVPAEQ